MLSRRLINLLSDQHVSLLCQKLRNFSHGFSPIKPGVLLVRSSIDVKIKAAAYTLNQPTCQAEVNLSSGSHPDAKTFYDKLNIEVTEHDSHNELKVDVPSSLAQESLCLNICIPHHYSVHLEGEGNTSTQISKLECDMLNLKLEDGNCELVSMKSLDTDISGKDMNVVFVKPFVGNLTASVRNGSVMADKLQGQDFALSAVSGNIHINSLYAAKSTLQCNRGDIDINNCHGATVIYTTEGDIKLSELVIVWGLINSHSLPGTLWFPE